MPQPETKPAPPSVLVLACGALARELLNLVAANELTEFHVECLPAKLHHTPAAIPRALRQRLETASERYAHVVVGYADCGTAGAIDELCAEFGAVRLPGEHCFEFFAGRDVYLQLQDAEPGTFYVTDFLARHFELFVLDGLGISAHPELEPLYFGNYRRLVYLSQAPTPDLVQRAEAAATRLRLGFEHQPSGYGELEPVMVEIGRATRAGRRAELAALELAAGRA